MFEKFKHTNKCTTCERLYQYDNYTEPTTCECGGQLKYIGFQPEMDALTVMLNNLKSEFKNGPEDKNVEVVNVNTAKEVEPTEINTGVQNETNEQQKTIEIGNCITATEITSEQAQKIEEAVTPIEEVESEQPAIALKIEDIIDTSGKVSNAQMIPALKAALGERSKEKVILLKENYEKVYESSLKYIGKKNTAILQELLG